MGDQLCMMAPTPRVCELVSIWPIDPAPVIWLWLMLKNSKLPVLLSGISMSLSPGLPAGRQSRPAGTTLRCYRAGSPRQSGCALDVEELERAAVDFAQQHVALIGLLLKSPNGTRSTCTRDRREGGQ